MENTIAYSYKKNIRYLLFDAGALSFIYFVPALSHLLNIPVYLYDPMRLMLFLSLTFSSRNNSFIIALSLPFFSYLISSHPSVIKSALIAVELSLNVFLFYLFVEMLTNKFTAAFLSIVISKVIYYLLKFALISFAFLEGDLISTPIYIQFFVAIVLSLSIFGLSLFRNNKT